MPELTYIYFEDDAYKSIAKYYSEKFKLQVATTKPKSSYIHISNDTSLNFSGKRIKNNFNKGAFRNRIIKYQTEHLLKKAIGHKEYISQKILDTTGGLGHDAFLLSLLGHHLTVIEENKGLCVLFEEALRNLPQEEYFEEAKSKIKILNDNSENYKDRLYGYDTVYVDPMFATKTRAARSGNIALLRNYLGDQDDISKSLINGNFKRMAIKRPSGYFNELPIKPDLTIKGKAIIFEVFLNINNKTK
tara:strand:+ start:2303 stop:3040 length:738 start_codon:yes stop_codon:yes gene_type:complete